MWTTPNLRVVLIPKEVLFKKLMQRCSGIRGFVCCEDLRQEMCRFEITEICGNIGDTQNSIGLSY